MVGWGILRHYRELGITPFCNPFTNLPECQNWNRIDLEQKDSFKYLFDDIQPDLLIYCAGICDLEKCAADPDWAYDINVRSIKFLLESLPKTTRLVYYSSDHVFSGNRGPYNELSKPDPISVYGKTRVEAEKIIQAKKKEFLILRSGLSIGPSIGGKTGHLNWIQYRHANGLPMTIIADEFRSTVWTRDLVTRMMELALSDKVGIRHIVADQVVSRLHLARYLNQEHHIGASFNILTRDQLKKPHLGRVELSSIFDDPYSRPLPSVLPTSVLTDER